MPEMKMLQVNGKALGYAMAVMARFVVEERVTLRQRGWWLEVP